MSGALLQPVGRHRASADLLRAVRGEELVGSYAAVADASELVALAVHHRIAPQLRRQLDLQGLAIAEVGRLALDTAARNTALHNLRARGALAWLSVTLEGLPWFVIKGPALSFTVYDTPEERTFTDLDVVVPPSSLAVVLQRLRAAGARVHDRDWQHLIDQRAGEMTLSSPYGITIDLHWRLHNDIVLCGHGTLPIEELLERSRVVRIDDRPIRTLGGADALAHLAVHTCGSGGDRLSWFLDVDRFVRRGGLDGAGDGAQVRRCIDRHGAALAVDLVLDRARILFGTPRPHPLGPKARGSLPWRGLTRCTRWVGGPPRTLGGPTLDRLVLRSVRADAIASARALATKTRLATRGRRDAQLGPPTVVPALGTAPSGDRANLEHLITAVVGHGDAW